MPTPLRNPTLALVGLAVVALLCVQLLRHAITLETAAWRAVLTVGVLAVIDRIALPIGRAMLNASGPKARVDTDDNDDQRRVP